jgi:DNA primase
MASVVEHIKEKLGIADVIGSYIKMEKAGGNFKAPCPFHNEKNPSFFISPARGSFYCFGCGAKGDIFSFVEQFEGVDFPGALKILADRAGVALSFEEFRHKDETAKLYEILEETLCFFERTLKKRSDVTDYLRGRGASDETIGAWRVGYASASWRDLFDYLTTEKRYTASDVEKVGLIKRPDAEGGGAGRFYDRFRGRIMFPIFDSSGRVVAFSGRIFETMEGGKPKEDEAKYINSPETPLFVKSKILYGFHRAKFPIRKFDFSILVEGQMDLLLSHQAGFSNTIALSGTALTADHLTLLRRLSNNVVIALDADAAGVASAGKGATLALAAGMDVKIAALPSGKDPADLIKEDKEAWRQAIRESKHTVNFHLDYLSETVSDPRKLKLDVQRIVIPFVAAIPNKIDQAHFIGAVAQRLSIDEDAVRSEIVKIPRPHAAHPAAPDTATPAADARPEKFDLLQRRLFGWLYWQETLEASQRSVKAPAVAKRLETILGQEAYHQSTDISADARSTLIFEAELSFEGSDAVEEDIEELLMRLEEETLKTLFGTALGELKSAEARHDASQSAEALKRCKDISEKLAHLHTIKSTPHA